MRAGFSAILFWAIQGFAAFNLTWGVPAVSLDSNPPVGDADVNPAIAIDPYGNAVATWGRTSGSGATEDIWAASFNHASRIWTGAVKVSGGGSASNSSVAMDATGNAVVIWEEGFPTQILYRTLTAEGVWTPSLSQSPDSVSASQNPQTVPHIIVDPEGNALAVWMEFVSGKNRIQSAKKTIGSDWQNLGALSSGTYDAAICFPVPIVMNSSGDSIAVWQESVNGSTEVHGAQYVNGTWMASLTISSGSQPSVGIDGTGNAVIVWNQSNMILSKTLVSGVLSAPLKISNPVFVAKHPCVAVDEVGNAVVVYERYDVGPMHKFIAGATLPVNETAWSSPIDISVPSPGDIAGAGYPRLCLNSIGDGVVIWKEFDGDHMVVQGAGYSLGSWSFIRTLSSLKDNSGSSTPSYDMGIALNLAGNIFAIWPEDPSGANTQHIKAAPGVGIAIAGPLPPVIVDPVSTTVGIGTGFQVLHRFPAHSDLINILDWASPGGVAYYKIYRGNLSSLIGTSNIPHYEDHQRVPREKVTYLITSVDSNEHESGPTTIIVHPR